MIRLLALSLLFTLCACSRSNKLIIGTDATYPPFEFVDEKGVITGVDIEIGREIGKALGREVEFKNINFDGLQTALLTNALDLVISSVSATPERRKAVDFSDPYVKTGLSVLVAKNSPVMNSGDLEAPGRKIVVRLGTTGETWAREHLKNAQIKALDNDTSCVMEVVNANVDAWIYDQVSIMRHHAEHAEKTRALLTPLREEVWAVALRQGETEMKAKINELLARMKADGSFKRLADRFMAKEQKMMAEQGIPFVFELK
ncbi:transporter substrate-binding domain-containing protein [Prosthecobacter sp.]|jgi:ABC-type amino acid transport substrate-binding protein|uniref:transporter substrate-binding domain-containing protein n=1 Tax=Prosthecobacter sp. TaxID=1965333 RepID=UPI003782EB63